MGPERTKFCDICQQDLKLRGWTTHHKACEKKAKKQCQNQMVQQQERDISLIGSFTFYHCYVTTGECEAQNEIDNDMGHIDFPDADVPEHVEPTFEVDDIMCEYHPSSKILPKVHVFHDFKCCSTPLASSAPPNKHPWAPFKLRLEFEFTELVLEACLNNEQTDRLIKLCNQCTSCQEKFTFQTHKDIHDRWDTASYRITGFTKDVISVPYDDELYTTEAFWNIQSQLPDGAKPLAFILYADKTKLSLFGTARGYPVVARLANLPTEIRNSQGIGGGYVVRWLPIVKEEKDHAGKLSWVNFKNAVWHEAFLKILSPLASRSSMGQWFECLDNLQCWFFPLILILSADYEEQRVYSIQNMLHFNRGLYHDHLWAELQKIITGLGRASVAKMDNNYKAFLWWRNLKHLAQVMSISFSNSSVYEDISKMVIYATHTIIIEDECPLSYHLLCCIHLFIEVDINKNWNFPKLHMSVHIFDNIEVKGATHNYNTKPNEKMHGLLKDSYLMCTNFRDVAPQILHMNHWQVVAENICCNISDFNEYQL
ncbi:hypothetical protein BDR06DRAFT_976428 [Suillus hirtellus]|nr:hypothetical protein BDR06DRAFT_976428 [Suillus hirtellus]